MGASGVGGKDLISVGAIVKSIGCILTLVNREIPLIGMVFVEVGGVEFVDLVGTKGSIEYHYFVNHSGEIVVCWVPDSSTNTKIRNGIAKCVC